MYLIPVTDDAWASGKMNGFPTGITLRSFTFSKAADIALSSPPVKTIICCLSTKRE